MDDFRVEAVEQARRTAALLRAWSDALCRAGGAPQHAGPLAALLEDALGLVRRIESLPREAEGVDASSADAKTVEWGDAPGGEEPAPGDVEFVGLEDRSLFRMRGELYEKFGSAWAVRQGDRRVVPVRPEQVVRPVSWAGGAGPGPAP